MPTFFQFTQGTESSRAARYAATNSDSSPLLGRFRALVPEPAGQDGANHRRGLRPRPSQLGLLSSYFGGGAWGSGTGDGSGGSGGGGGAGLGALGGLGGGRGSVHVGYGALVAARLQSEADDEEAERESRAALESDDDDDDDDDGDGFDDEDGVESHGRAIRSRWRRAGPKLRLRRRARRWGRTLARTARDLWVEPRQGAVKKVVDVWWSRWGVLVVLPAALAVGWCALPFPQYPLDDGGGGQLKPGGDDEEKKAPGHGAARVQVNFWFFLFVYYGFYNLTALIWITKVFNIYSLNWWPQSLGFPLTVFLIALVSLSVPIPIYLMPSTRFLTVHNTAWISWSFVIMALPVAIAFLILTTEQRHLGFRRGAADLSETQRIFTSSWWTGDGYGDAGIGGSFLRAPQDRRRQDLARNFDPDAALQVSSSSDGAASGSRAASGGGGPTGRKRWLPASFVRFVWFCLALSVGLLAYVIGEAYAEIYLRTLPHSSLETIVYVYSWVATVHLLDALTAWILGASEGERVGSYPLSWIFKLYFMLTYQTYVRALYARLRTPSQFIMLQAISSASLIILTPLMMSATFHWVLGVLNLTNQSYAAYQKVCARNVYIRFLAENVSMAAFLGSVVVLHFGANKNVYPYFAFDDPIERYDFALTFYASSVTWACELAAGLVVRILIRYCYGVSVGHEGKLDLAVWPELLPTSVAVMLHVVQNMLFSIIRLQFH